MGAELSHHLGYAPGEAQPDDTANHQTRPLEPLYPVVFFDAWRVKIGVWIEQTEGAKFWMKVFTELNARGCEDIPIAVTNGLTGMGDARKRCIR